MVPTAHPKQTRSFLVLGSTWSTERKPITEQQMHSAVEKDTLPLGKSLFVITNTDCDHITFLLSPSISSYDYGHVLLRESVKISFVLHFNAFLTTNGWEGDIKRHLDTADCL